MELVAVPGLGLGPESWRGVLTALGGSEDDVQLLPGYGVPTEPRRTAPPLPVLAAELVERLLGPTVLLGHSSSCQLVAHAARLAPERVRALVLVGPTTDPRARSWPGLAQRWLRTAGHEDPRQVPLLVRQYRRTTLRSMAATMDRARRDDVAGTLAEVRCPVLLLRGRHDRIAPHDWLAALAAGGPARTVVDLPAGAHMVPQTHPALLASRLAGFLGAQ